MTKRRQPLTFHRALTTIAGRIGWDTAGAICGVTDRTVRYWSDPDCETEIRLIDAQRLDRAFIEAGGDHAPFHRVYALRIDIAQHQTASTDLHEAVAHSVREVGEAASAIVMATKPNASASVINKALSETHEAIGALASTASALENHPNKVQP